MSETEWPVRFQMSESQVKIVRMALQYLACDYTEYDLDDLKITDEQLETRINYLLEKKFIG